MAQSHDLRQPRPGWRAGRARRERHRLDRQLRPDRARHDRPSRRPPTKTQTLRLWTCGQRRALPTGSTAPTTADLNETGIVLPMSSVRSVTYLFGCSDRIAGLTSLRANGSRECAPDDRLREAIHATA